MMYTKERLQSNSVTSCSPGMQVARGIVQGINTDRYIPRSPDSAADFLVSSCLTPCGPRPFPLVIDMFLAPLYVLLHWIVKRRAEDATHRILVKHLKPAVDTDDYSSFKWTLIALLVVAFSYVTWLWY